MSRVSPISQSDIELFHRLVGGDGGAALEALLDGFRQRHPDVPMNDVTDENLSLAVKSRILKENPPDSWLEWPGKNLQPYTDAGVLGDVSPVWTGGDMEQALRDFCAELRDRHSCRAFVASDIDIPTYRQARELNERRGDDEPEVQGMAPLDQSIAFAAHSDAVLFLFTQGGLTTGVGTETGGILGEFHLRRGNPATTHKPSQRVAIYQDAEFGSATVDELPYGFDVRYDEFRRKADLHDRVRNWFDALTREARDTDLPVFVPGETYAPEE